MSAKELWMDELKVQIPATSRDGSMSALVAQTCMACGALVAAGPDGIAAHEGWHERLGASGLLGKERTE